MSGTVALAVAGFCAQAGGALAIPTWNGWGGAAVFVAGTVLLNVSARLDQIAE